MAADHKPDASIDDKTEKDSEKENLTVKSEKDKDQSPRKSRSKSISNGFCSILLPIGAARLTEEHSLVTV